MKIRLALASLVAVGSAFAPFATAAQTVTLDEGTFTLYRGESQVGTESFAIRRSGTGEDAVIVANATVEMELPGGMRTMAPALEATGREMALSAYQMKVSGSQEAEVYLTLSGSRFVARITTEAGEREQEFRASPGALLLEEGVAHQYYFLRPILDDLPTQVPVIMPQEGSQLQMQVSSLGQETLRIGGEPIGARHLRLEAGGEVREVWVDGEGRVLRLVIPASSFRAEREAPPGPGPE